MTEGTMPGMAQRIIKEWCMEHQEELLANWARAQQLLPLERIKGADDD
jgi:hypothetical protein